MKRLARRLGRWTASAGVLAALGFGATQALASPPGPGNAPPACNGGDCHRLCRSIGATGGHCAGDQCFCYWIIPADPS